MGLREGRPWNLWIRLIAYLREGFGTINNPKGLLIALAMTIFLGSWKQWFPVAIVAVIVHIAIEQLAPVLAGEGGSVVLPDLMERDVLDTRARSAAWLSRHHRHFLLREEAWCSGAVAPRTKPCARAPHRARSPLQPTRSSFP
jgi:hypothetical protein